MVNIEKHIAYWIEGSEEDWAVSIDLQKLGRSRHTLFFAHLSLEKILKAHVCRNTGDIAPRIHNLVRLSELSGIVLSEEHIGFLAEMNAFNLEGRYPSPSTPQITADILNEYMNTISEIRKCLMSQLEKR
ncbi:MAG TPA: HEPN domain-containing protein [Spirochaetota bacterium]|nr:HEPN domain-containing protein [Spirochaetota bacterium]HPI87983.1 HEPN domain-containing protein [Spirochaetota bacterium]HPR46694.1 HEPN domain-containing protein [Spirochaetota bacterium]